MSFILFLSSLNEVCFMMICKIKLVESGGFEESDIWLFLVGSEVSRTCPVVLV